MRNELIGSLALSCSMATAMAQSPTPPETVQPQQNVLEVELSGTQGNRVSGDLRLSPDNHGLHISGSIRGLKANAEHGFHVHQTADCSAPDGSSAGDHFNPEQVAHGSPAREPHHAGDMPNLTADGQGVAELDLHVPGLTLGDGGEHDVMGRALIVHADADDYRSQPSGNAGARIACGAIVAAAPDAAEGESR